MQIGYSFSIQTKINDHLVHKSSIPFPIGRQGLNSNWSWKPKGMDKNQLDDSKRHLRGECQMQKSPANKPNLQPLWTVTCQAAVCREGPTDFRDPGTVGVLGIVCPQHKKRQMSPRENTCKSVLCKPQKNLLCSIWHRCSLSWSLVSSSQHHALRKMEVGQGP